MSIAIVFSQFGPYHHSRVLALQRSGVAIKAVQVAEASRTYAWTQNASTVENIYSLTKGAEEDATFFQVFRKACQFWSREKIRIAFLPSYFPATSLALLLSAKVCGVKCIMMNESHAGTEKASGVKRNIKKCLISLFHGAILGGSPHVRHFESLGMRNDKMVTGYDAIDNQYFSDQAEIVRRDSSSYRNKLGLPERYILSLGRMVEKKNLALLVEAFGLHRKNQPDSTLKLAFVGSGECQQSLIALCNQQGLTHTDHPQADVDVDVRFFGFRQIDENPAFYALAEAFVLPSLYEEWGLVVNEAMACGLPILVSETVGSAEDLVQPGVNGYHFDPRSALDLAEKIQMLDRDEQLRSAMGQASLSIIKEWGCENFAIQAKKIISIVSGTTLIA